MKSFGNTRYSVLSRGVKIKLKKAFCMLELKQKEFYYCCEKVILKHIPENHSRRDYLSMISTKQTQNEKIRTDSFVTIIME